MVRQRKASSGKLEFSRRGRRRFNYSGLYYWSEGGKYALYRSDKLYGIKLKPVLWIAFWIEDDGRCGAYRIISRHPSRKSAERACEAFDKSHTG